MSGVTMIAYLTLMMLLAAGTQVSAGMLGSLLYPCGWMRYWILLSLAIELFACAAAAILLKRGGREARGDDACALQKSERRVWMIWLGMLAGALMLGFAIGAAGPAGVYVRGAINAVVGLVLVAPLLSFALCWPSTAQPHGRRGELRRDEFPMLHGILMDSARDTGHRRRTRLFLGEGTACAYVGVGYDGIIISPLFLSALTKQELRQVFRHEFAHLASKEVRRELRWRRLAARLAHTRICMQDGWMLLAIAPVLCAAERFGEQLERYLKKIEPQREREADACAAVSGEARYAVAAAAKAEFTERFIEEKRVLPRDAAALRAAYEQAVAERGRIWLAELEGQEASDCDPHPAFRERREIFGAAEYDPFERETDESWLREVDRACAKAYKNRKRR